MGTSAVLNVSPYPSYLEAAFNNCATTNQLVTLKVSYTGACGQALIQTFGPIPIQHGQHGIVSVPFTIPKNACTGLYTLTLDSYVGGIKIGSTHGTIDSYTIALF